jgi:hypothetical protein
MKGSFSEKGKGEEDGQMVSHLRAKSKRTHRKIEQEIAK